MFTAWVEYNNQMATKIGDFGPENLIAREDGRLVPTPQLAARLIKVTEKRKRQVVCVMDSKVLWATPAHVGVLGN